MRVQSSETIPDRLSLTSFRAYLQSEFARRCLANEQYSLRSFALQLRINHSTLSQLLRGKRKFTARMIRRLAGKLSLTESQVDAFVAYEEFAVPDSHLHVIEIKRLVQDTLCLISTPYHQQVLELVKLEDFKPDSRWIARVLDLSVDEVNVAIQRLLRLGLLEMTSVNKWTTRCEAEDVSTFARTTIQRLSQRVHELERQESNSK